jgi:radical SAM protein with 4Fe4S-binding SPASM domain
MFKKRYTPISVVWETTLNCNMRCLHCGSSAGQSRKNELTTQQGLSLCEDLKKLGTRLITLMGGEPFLRKDWRVLAQHIRNLGMNFTIMTNGLIIDEKIVSQLIELDPYTVAISLDGGTAETHNSIRRVDTSFERCIRSLGLLRRANLPATVVTTVHKQNFKELPTIRDFLLKKGIAWQIQMANPVGRFPESLMLSKKEFYSVALFIASMRKKYSTEELPLMGAHNFGYHSKILPNITILPWIGCQAGLTAIGIQSDGGVKGCLSLPDGFVEGNIREKSIADIWNDSNSFSYNRNFKKEDLNDECKDCKNGRRCRGGCLTVSSSLTGKNHCDPYCLNLIERKMISV